MNQFRYVDATCDSAVNLHLFRTPEGTPRGDVLGPLARLTNGACDISNLDLCLPVPHALASAIGMAQRNHVEMVVTGDATLWNPEWGVLSVSVIRSTGTLTLKPMLKVE